MLFLRNWCGWRQLDLVIRTALQRIIIHLNMTLGLFDNMHSLRRELQVARRALRNDEARPALQLDTCLSHVYLELQDTAQSKSNSKISKSMTYTTVYKHQARTVNGRSHVSIQDPLSHLIFES